MVVREASGSCPICQAVKTEPDRGALFVFLLLIVNQFELTIRPAANVFYA